MSRANDALLPRPVLLALDDGIAPQPAIVRATSLAREQGTRLHVLVAVTGGRRDRAHLDAVAAHVRRRLALVLHGATAELTVRAGSLVASTIAVGRRVAPRVVVTSTAAGVDGALAVVIADHLEVPVLVAREPRTTGRIMAATDLRDPRYPVLTASLAFARSLRRPITYVHHAPPTDTGGTALARLCSLAANADEADAIVVHSRATVDAILETARARDADVVTVGSARGTWLGGVLGRRIAQRVVDRCRRSVLVVPLAPARRQVSIVSG